MKPPTPAVTSKALPNLDFIRAVAVMSVVVVHVLLAYNVHWFGRFEVGWIAVVGVFVFFVHTSLVLMWSLERKPHTLDFYIRRVFRIYPIVFLAVGATLLFHAPVGGNSYHFFVYVPPPRWPYLLSALALAQNIIGGYLPVSVMWTLPYEMQMYLALPVLYFFVRKNFSLWPLLLFWGFMVLTCASLFRGVPHNIFLCIPYFLPGVMAYVGFGRRTPVLPGWLLPPALAIVWFVFMLDPGWRVADLLCLTVGLGLPFFRQIAVRWLIRCSHEIAKYSYSMYLIHPFSIVLGIYLMPHHALGLQLTVIITSLVALSVASYHLVEYPMIRLGARLARKAETRFEQFEATLPVRQIENRAEFETRPTE